MNKIKKHLFSPTPSVVKRSTVAMLCLMLTGLFLIAGCKKDDPKTSGSGEEPEYPINIPFTEYELAETCQWTNLAYDDTVIIINSEEELQQYVACTGNGYPEIDFVKHTLLLASGRTNSGISEITVKDLQQLAANEYELNIELNSNYLLVLVVEEWSVALIVDKLIEKSVVELQVITQMEEPEYPINILFEEYVLPETFHWENLAYDDKVIIINNDEQLSQYVAHTSSYYPVIDFAEHTLLLASGKADFWITKTMINNLQQLSALEYELDMDIFLDEINDIDTWDIALIVDKINEESTAELNITSLFLPQEPCHCIMDTLKGEWSWYQTYTAKHGLIENEYKSIIKILSQNEDATVNYKVIVEDTLFHKGSFQIQDSQWVWWTGRVASIKLPHWTLSLLVDEYWLLYFGDIQTGIPSENTLCLFSGAADADRYYYQKIK